MALHTKGGHDQATKKLAHEIRGKLKKETKIDRFHKK